MKNKDKTKEPLIEELVELRHRISELRSLKSIHKRVEGDLRRSKEWFKKIFDNAKDGIFIETPAGKILDVNRAACHMLGYSKEELLAMEVGDIVPLEIVARLAQTIQKETVKKGVYIETFDLRKDGKWIPIEVSNTLVEIEGEKRVIAIIRDITERKKAERALRKARDNLEMRVKERTAELAKANKELWIEIGERKRAEKELRERARRFTDIAKNALEWIWEFDTEGKYTYAGPVVEKILGYKVEEILNKHFYDLFHPEERDELKKKAFEVLLKKKPFRKFINRNMHKNGRTVWLSTSGVPIIDEKGKFVGYRGANTDITELKEVEEELKKYRGHLEEMVERRTTVLRRMIDAMAGRVVRMADLEFVIEKLRDQLKEAGLKPVADLPLKGKKK